MNYETIIEDKDGLGRHRWRFWVNGTQVILDDYRRETRVTKRHKFSAKFEDIYCRIDGRNGGLPVHSVPHSRHARLDILRQIVKDLRVVIRDGRGIEAPFAPDQQRTEP